jgi:hypothetical protein
MDFSQLRLGEKYTRPELARLWGYQSHHAISKGVVTLESWSALARNATACQVAKRRVDTFTMPSVFGSRAFMRKIDFAGSDPGSDTDARITRARICRLRQFLCGILARRTLPTSNTPPQVGPLFCIVRQNPDISGSTRHQSAFHLTHLTALDYHKRLDSPHVTSGKTRPNGPSTSNRYAVPTGGYHGPESICQEG